MDLSWASIIVAALGVIGVLGYVKKILNEQKQFIEALAKLHECTVEALADNKVDNKEIQQIMEATKKCHEEGMDVIEAYTEAAGKLVGLVKKVKG